MRNAGQMAVVMVRVRIAIGSAITPVWFPSAAAVIRIANARYFTVRQRSDTFSPFLAFLGEIQFTTLPIGQTQPHHTRPKTSAATMLMSA